jgi:TolB-like protein/tetratricopeptide (TPR) repeat protein
LSFFNELKRRNVIRVGIAYVAVYWLLIQVMETVLPFFGISDAFIRSIIIILAIGIVPVLIAAWIFQLTPDGLKKDDDLIPQPSTPAHGSTHFDRAIMAVLALSLTYFALDKFVLAPEDQAEQLELARQEARSEAFIEAFGDNSIAVLPFVDMSPEGDQGYFSDGIAEELLNVLARIPALRVISRSSAFSFQGKDIGIMEIAKQLNVAYTLEGSVRRSGNRIRISTKLIDTRSDSHVWSETFDRAMDDIFAVQDEITALVAAKLKVKILGEPPGTHGVDPEAYALFLQARHIHLEMVDSELDKVEELYHKALDIEPGYAAALAGLATIQWRRTSMGETPQGSGIELARETAFRALDADPENVRALCLLGHIALYSDGDLAKSAGYTEQAMRADPTSLVAIGYSSDILQSLGRLDEANVFREYIVSRNPTATNVHRGMGKGYFNAGRLEEARASIQTALNLSPRGRTLHWNIAKVYLLQGRPEMALAESDKESDKVFGRLGMVMAYHDLGQTDASDKLLNQLIQENAEDAGYQIAMVLAYRNDRDDAFEWLEKDFQTWNRAAPGMAQNIMFRNLHDDPRWPVYLEKIGQAPAQMAQINFDVALP